MFQSYEVTTNPGNGPKRLAELRAVMRASRVDAFLVPRSDAYRGETVASCDERLAWLTGFTGSAGYCAVTFAQAALFVDSRYTLQAAAQVATDHFTLLAIPADKTADFLKDALKSGSTVAYDPWLHTKGEIDRLSADLKTSGINLLPTGNLVDPVWADRPARPSGKIAPHPIEFAGKSHDDKRREIAADLKKAGVTAHVLTLPASIAWLLNIRGSDIARTPVAHAFATIRDTGTVTLFCNPDKVDDSLREHLGADVGIIPDGMFINALDGIDGKIGIDKDSAPVAVSDAIAPERIVWQRDPCILPQAIKNPVELDGARAAGLRDAAAMVEFLCWLDGQTGNGTLTEIDVAKRLEEFRRATNALRDVSFETISGAGPNGAIVHYRVNTDTNRTVTPGDILLVDSGGQYRDGTTDITRTIATGTPPEGATKAFTAVLSGMISLSRTRFPEGLAGRDIDALARADLWRAGLDYDHGTGHGVGSYLSVHEGPASISRRSEEPLKPGMILSNEPGYYEQGAFGIRIENLIAVTPATRPEGGQREMLGFETLTYVPIDRRLIDTALLSPANRQWLDAYHNTTRDRLHGLLSDQAESWLHAATRPL